MIIIILGYIGGILVFLHLLSHLFQTLILHKKVKAGQFDLIVLSISLVFILLYAAGTRDYPFVLYIVGTSLWMLSGLVDFFQRYIEKFE